MAITEQQRTDRRNYIGASDLPIIMGCSRFRNITDLWAEKVCGAAESSSVAADLGNIIEPWVLARAREELADGRVTAWVENIERRYCDDPPLIAHLDMGGFESQDEPPVVAPDLSPVVVVEAKTSGILSGRPDEYGEPMTDQVPPHVFIQCQGLAASCGLDEVHVFALLAGRGDRPLHYVVPFAADIWSVIIDNARRFWTHVEAKIMPSGWPAMSADMIRRVNRQPGKVIPATYELRRLVGDWLVAKDASTAAAEQADLLKREIETMMGDAEAADMGGGTILTYLLTKRRGYEVKPTEFRTLKLVNKKGTA